MKPKVLLISSKLDFSTDLICLKLHAEGVPYLRLNRDQLEEYHIELNPLLPELTVKSDQYEYLIEAKTLNSVYYRAPTFLREIFYHNASEDDQLYQTQWAAFVRCLLLFEEAKWINNPTAIYRAEMKPIQLLLAKRIGFNVPQTIITNSISTKHLISENIAIKSLDTLIISKGEEEAFIYTTLIPSNEVKIGHYNSPFFLQEGLIPKIDLRITVIGNEVIAVTIESNSGIDIDWRKYKGELKYELFSLPNDIRLKCLKLTRALKLNFAAIDLIMHNGKYYFIEVNPTGEWAWLQKNTSYPFDIAITKNLINDKLA